MKRFLFVILVTVGTLASSLGVKAQDSTTTSIDSLIVLLMNDHEDTSRVEVYNQLSDEYLTIDYSKSLEYSTLALDLASKLNFDEGLLRAHIAIAHIQMAYLLNYKKSQTHYDAALPIALRLEDKVSEMSIYKGLSYIYSASDNFRLALDYNSRAIKVAEQLEDITAQSELNAYLGGIYEDSGDTIAAIDAYAEVLAIERANNFKNTSNASMSSIARYYLLIEDFGQALKYYKIVLKNAERNDDFRWLAYTHSQMANLYLLRQNESQAEEHGIRGLEIAEMHRLQKEMTDNYLALFNVYSQMDSVDKAQEYKSSYDSLTALMVPTFSDEGTVLTSATEFPVENHAQPNPMKSWMMIILLIIMPVGAVIFFIARKKK